MTDIQAWRSQTQSPADSDEGSARKNDDWRQTARSRLSSSSTKRRLSVLSQLGRVSQHAEAAERALILRYLLSTVPLYVDGVSRKATLRVLRSTLERAFDESTTGGESFPALLKWVQAESSRVNDTFSPTIRYNLVCWCCEIFHVAVRRFADFATSAQFSTLVTAMSLAFASTATTRSAIHKGAIVVVRAAVRQNKTTIPALLTLLCKEGLVHAPLLGLVIDVVAHLKLKDGNNAVQEQKNDILQYYLTQILNAKPAPSATQLHALHGFLANDVTMADVETAILPVLEKLLIRQPEAILPIATALCKQTSLKLDLFLARTLPQIKTLSRSTSAATRRDVVLFFSALIAKCSDPAALSAAHDLSSPIQTGKSASAEHRAVLFAMIAECPPDSSLGQLALNSKEASSEASAALVKHLPMTIGQAAIELDPKTIRKGVLPAIGDALWNIDATRTNLGVLTQFYERLVTLLESSLKNSPNTPIDGLVAIALAKCQHAMPLGPAFVTFSNSTAGLQNLLGLGLKPSILLNEKVYRKLESASDDEWFLRALFATLRSERMLLVKDVQVAAAAAQSILYFAVENPRHRTRRRCLQELRHLNSDDPTLAYALVYEGSQKWLLTYENLPGDEAIGKLPYVPRLRKVLSTLIAFGPTLTIKEREDLLAGLAVLANHPFLASKTSFWIELMLLGDVKPDRVVDTHLTEIMGLVAHFAPIAPTVRPFNSRPHAFLPTIEQSVYFATAAMRACSDLVLICPERVVPMIFEQVTAALDPTPLVKCTQQDILIWQSNGEELVVDVLTALKKAKRPVANGKDADLIKWDHEQRQELAKKKGATSNVALSKNDRALVDAQLEKERVIRKQVSKIYGTIRGGLHRLDSVLAISSVDHNTSILSINEALLRIACAPHIMPIAQDIWATYKHFATNCLKEAIDMIIPLSSAVLRSVNSLAVPETLLLESLSSLTTRCLYRLRSIMDDRAVCASFFCFASTLLSRVATNGGLGLGTHDVDARLEQVQLATDLISSQCHSASNDQFPRVQIITDLLRIIAGYPQLAKSATTALVSLSESIEVRETQLEIEVLSGAAMTEEAHMRLACLQALQPLNMAAHEPSVTLWILCHDPDERNKKLASSIWEDNSLHVTEAFLPQLFPYLSHASDTIRGAAARTMAAVLSIYPERLSEVLTRLVAEYVEQNKTIAPEYDRFGMLIEASLVREDPWRTRAAIASALISMAPLFQATSIDAVFKLLIEQQALDDRSAEVRSKMLETGITVIDLHGKANLQNLMNIFEINLKSGSADSDHITESVVILFGRLAEHLEPEDIRIQAVITRLLGALHTPSEDVQVAISECLPPLIKSSKERAASIIDSLWQDTIHAQKYAERRGAAYGLAGTIKGRGIGSLKEFHILNRIKEAIEDKKDSTARQGAVFAIETLSFTMGRIFEPYIIQVLPLLLQTFGDGVVEVRNATQDAARVIMGKLSGHAVKLILPSLLAGLEDRQWRSKKGAIELLGTMAFLAPRQLSLSLPTILPRLTEVLTDTHAQVRAAANASLKQFGEILTNPEVQAMQSILLDALIDPTRKTLKALDALLGTTFAHFIDTSSLALVVPILERGIRDRSTEMKRKSAQIVGTLASITEARNLFPYLPQLVPKMREVLIDPVPEARATAAQALGGLVERLGEDAFPDLIPSLLGTLQSETTGIDQQGAAQGLAEILAGLGTERLEDLLPDIIQQTRSSRFYIREGFISLLVFLPVTFGDRFSPYLAQITQPILAGLADDSDYVREASLKAGRMIVSTHANKAITLLLPELERGVFDRNHRIRHSSMQLIGELLFKVTGISGKAELTVSEEDEEDGQTATVKISLVDVLGREHRNRVLAAIFIVRQDSSGPVRQLAVNVWKVLVSNTPRTVREVLATLSAFIEVNYKCLLRQLLVQIIIRQLAAHGSDQRECAARALGDLCRKMGESVLADLMPVLNRGIAADERTRQGVQLALNEILAACSDAQIESQCASQLHVPNVFLIVSSEHAIVGAIRAALVDTSASVRAAAAQAFDALQSSIGARAIDMTVPVLLENLRRPGQSADAALAALQEVMSVRADKIVPVLIPSLIKTPITAFNARALASLVGVAGHALSRSLSSIIDALEDTRLSAMDEEVLAEIKNAARALLASIKDTESLSLVEMHLISLAKDTSSSRRAGACDMLATLSAETSLDFSDYYVDWVRILVSLFDDHDSTVVKAAWHAMDALVSHIPKDDLENLAPALRRSIETTGTPGVNLAGFELGLKPLMRAYLHFVPMVQSTILAAILSQGLLAGTAEQREQAAYAMGDIVERISLDALRPHVTQIAGPLIRIIAERFPAPVRAAILHTLTIIVAHVPNARPFYPQIQRTFSKSVADPASLAVRNRGATGLGVLMAFQPRIDPLITELVNGATKSDSTEVQESYLDALAKSIQSGGGNMTQSSQGTVMDLLRDAFSRAPTLKESTSTAMSQIFAAMLSRYSLLIQPLVETHLVNPGPTSQLASLCLFTSVEASPDALYGLEMRDSLISAIVRTAQIPDNPAVARPARQSRDLLRMTPPWSDDREVQDRL